MLFAVKGLLSLVRMDERMREMQRLKFEGAQMRLKSKIFLVQAVAPSTHCHSLPVTDRK